MHVLFHINAFAMEICISFKLMILKCVPAQKNVKLLIQAIFTSRTVLQLISIGGFGLMQHVRKLMVKMHKGRVIVSQTDLCHVADIPFLLTFVCVCNE